MTFARRASTLGLAVVLTSIHCTEAGTPAAEPTPVAEPGTPAADPQRGVTLARTSGRGSIDAGVTKVFVRADAVLVDETPAMGIEPASHHMLGRLAERLDGHAAIVAVYPDRSLRYGDVVDILYTAAQKGVEHVVVTVETAHGPAAFRALAPSTWNQHPKGVGEPACNPTLHLDRTRARFSDPCTRLEREAPVADLQAVSKAFTTIVDGGPQLTILWVLGSSDTPWPTVVSVLDAVRGPDCPLGHTHEDRIAGCNNVLVALDLDPPIPWRRGNWDALEVEVESVEHVELARRRRSLAGLRAQATAALPEIRECLRSSDAMRVRMPERIDVVLATDPKGATLAMVDAGAARGHVPACVGEAFAPIAEHWGSLVPGDAVIRLAVRLPADGR